MVDKPRPDVYSPRHQQEAHEQVVLEELRRAVITAAGVELLHGSVCFAEMGVESVQQGIVHRLTEAAVYCLVNKRRFILLVGEGFAAK